MGNWEGRKCTNVGLHENGKWKVFVLGNGEEKFAEESGGKGVYI